MVAEAAAQRPKQAGSAHVRSGGSKRPQGGRRESPVMRSLLTRNVRLGVEAGQAPPPLLVSRRRGSRKRSSNKAAQEPNGLTRVRVEANLDVTRHRIMPNEHWRRR